MNSVHYIIIVFVVFVGLIATMFFLTHNAADPQQLNNNAADPQQQSNLEKVKRIVADQYVSGFDFSRADVGTLETIRNAAYDAINLDPSTTAYQTDMVIIHNAMQGWVYSNNVRGGN